MSKYLPPAAKYNPVVFQKLNINLNIKQKSIEDILEKERSKNYGKADDAWKN